VPESSGHHSRIQRGGRVGASTGGGSGRQGASGGERAGVIVKASSMAAVEEAAAARKRAADRAKKAKADRATRASESRCGKEGEHDPRGAWHGEASAGHGLGGEEKRQGRDNDEDEDTDGDDELAEFERYHDDILATVAGVTTPWSGNRTNECSDVKIPNHDNLLPPQPSPPLRTKRYRHEESSSSPLVGEGSSPSASKKPCGRSRTTSPALVPESSGHHSRIQRGGRGGASTGGGSGRRRVPNGKRPRSVGKASSMAAVEEAAAARKRAADLAKKAKAVKVTRGTGSKAKHDRKGAWGGDPSEGPNRVEEKEQGRDNDEDEDEDDDDELAEFERYHDDILATVAGVTTPSRSGNSYSAAAAGVRGGATSAGQTDGEEAAILAPHTAEVAVATIKKEKRQRPRDDGKNTFGKDGSKRKQNTAPAAPRTKKSSGLSGAPATVLAEMRSEKKPSFFASRGDRKPASRLTVQREYTRPGGDAASPVGSRGSSPHGEIISRVQDDNPVALPARAIDRAVVRADEEGRDKG
ncbi:unnamed protein product, partial [Sphacelaria rigidula]